MYGLTPARLLKCPIMIYVDIFLSVKQVFHQVLKDERYAVYAESKD